MARHQIKAARPKPEKPRAEIRAAPTLFEKTHPVGSAERFLDDAAREALAAAAAGGLAEPRQLAAGAVKAIAKKASEYPDPLLERVAALPAAEIARKAARAEAYNQAMQAQNRVADVVSASLSPVADIARAQTAAAIAAQQDAKGGRTVRAAQGSQQAEPPVDEETPAAQPSGPRIVINPTTFRNSKDALCVAFNEGFRLWMEATGFEPQSEPTDAQRKFFSDTAYADDEVQLRRTILARIATFDTSVKDPTDDQLSETASFLNAVLESDWCKNDWERNSVQKLARAVEASVGAEPVEPRAEPLEPRAEAPLEARAALGGGETDEDNPAAPKPVEPPQDASGGEDLETPAGGDLTSGSGAVVHYNEDGSFAGQDNPDGSYSLASASGEVANYNPDGTLQGDAGRFEAAGTTAAESAVARADRLLAKLNDIRGQVDAVDEKYGITEKLKQESEAEQVAMEGVDGGRAESPVKPARPDYVPPAGVAIVAVPAARKPAQAAAEAPAEKPKPAEAAPEPAEPAVAEVEKPGKLRMNGPSIQPVRKIGDIGATSFTDTKSMNGPSIQPVRKIGDIGATSFTDTGPMNGPSIAPSRPIGTTDTLDGSGGSTLRRKKKRRSRT